MPAKDETFRNPGEINMGKLLVPDSLLDQLHNWEDIELDEITQEKITASASEFLSSISY